MNEREFRDITRELLTETWGPKSYPDAVLGRLWRIVKDIQGSDLRAGLDNLSMHVTRAPNLGQIRAACLPALQRAQDAKRQEKLRKLEVSKCVLCAGSGWVFVIPYDNPLAEGVFICTKCEAASVRGHQIQGGHKHVDLWDDALEAKYFVRRFTARDALKALELQRAVCPKPPAARGIVDVATGEAVKVEEEAW